MNLNSGTVKKIRGLIVFAAIMILALMKFDLLCQALVFVVSISTPFLLGAVIAFVINLPMSFYERVLFEKESFSEKTRTRLAKIKRPVSLVLALVSVVLVLVLVLVTVIPQLVATVQVLVKEVPVFAEKFWSWLEVVLASNPELLAQLKSIKLPEINWPDIFQKIWGFLQSGVSNVVTSTFTVASSIVSGTVNFFIALIFSFYILLQKEKLGNQFGRVIKAYTKPDVYTWVMKVARMLYHNFSKFITGQCTEALILGALFVFVMWVLRFPFAFMVGVLIAFTSLIPVVGAFIGCFIGAFLILVDSPQKVIAFLIVFIIIQQLEGNLIYPHVVGNSVGLPSIWVLAAVTIGGSLMGVVGMLIFIPLLSTVYALLKEDVNKRNQTEMKVSKPPAEGQQTKKKDAYAPKKENIQKDSLKQENRQKEQKEMSGKDNGQKDASGKDNEQKDASRKESRQKGAYRKENSQKSGWKQVNKKNAEKQSNVQKENADKT